MQNASNQDGEGNGDLTEEELLNKLQDDIDGEGAVYKVPDIVDSFVSFSWILVVPDDDSVYLSRWKPKRDEEISYARKSDLETPRNTGIHMWSPRSPEYVAEYVSEQASTIEKIGGVVLIEYDDYDHASPHLDLDNPEEETTTRDLGSRGE